MIDGPQRDEDLGIEAIEGDTEEIDAIPVLDEAPAIAPLASTSATARVRSQSLASLRSAPAVQAAAVAAGGFVAGAAVVGLARRRQNRLARGGGRLRGGSRRERRGKGSRESGLELLQVVGSRSLLVDVHLLGARQR